MAVPILQHLLPLGLEAYIGAAQWLGILHQALVRARLLGHIAGHLLHDLLLEVALVILVAAGRQLSRPKTTGYIGGTGNTTWVITPSPGWI